MSQCPRCGSPAYVGLVKVECENSACECYKAPAAEFREVPHVPGSCKGITRARNLSPLDHMRADLERALEPYAAHKLANVPDGESAPLGTITPEVMADICKKYIAEFAARGWLDPEALDHESYQVEIRATFEPSLRNMYIRGTVDI